MTKQELKELLTPEFLSTLHTAVECCGDTSLGDIDFGFYAAGVLDELEGK